MRRLLFISAPFAYSHFIMSEPPSYQEKIRGVYENKIRQNAAPEKIFETFASIKEGKKFYMSPKDLFHAITPFNHSHAIEKNAFEATESVIIKAVDSNKDGRISFAEYFFFVVLLSTPNSIFRDMINKRGGSINKDQFVEVMLEAKEISPQGKRLVKSNSLDPRSTNITNQDFKDSCENLHQELFKNAETITWDNFKGVKDLISEELLTYEFNRFNIEDGTISAEDFGKSMIAYMPTSMTDMYLNRLELIKTEERVSFNEYLAFMFALQESHLVHQKLLLEHLEHGILKKPQIGKVLNEICNTSLICCTKNLKISDLQVEIFIKILDLDDSGSLEPEEIVNLVTSIGSQGTGTVVAPNIYEVINEFKRFMNALFKFSGITPIFKVKSE